MSLHLDLPREEHLNHLCRVHTFLNKHHNAELALDLSDPAVDYIAFEQRDWTSSEFGYALNKKKELIASVLKSR